MKMIPQNWFNKYQGGEWVTHPFHRLAWFLEDRKDDIEDETFYELIKELEYIYDREFVDLAEPETESKEDIALKDKARENVYKKLLREYEKKRNEDPDVLPILEQEEEGVKKLSFYDLGHNAHTISKMITTEFNRLKKLEEKKKEETIEESSVKPKRKVSTSKTKKSSTTTAKKKTTSTKTTKTASTKPRVTKTRSKVAK